MSNRSRFSPIPNIQQNGINDWEYYTLTAIKQNIELLAGTRGEADSASKAVIKGSITVSPVANGLTRITAEGQGFSVGGVTVPSLDDYAKLLANVQQLTNDVATLRVTLNTLIQQLRG